MTKKFIKILIISLIYQICAYNIKCKFRIRFQSDPIFIREQSEHCVVALFSNKIFLISAPFILLHSNDLCSVDNNEITIQDSVVGILRGNCSFETKATNAYNLGAIGLIIINNESPFPMSSSNNSYQSKIPALMIESKSINAVLNSSNSLEILDTEVTLKYG